MIVSLISHCCEKIPLQTTVSMPPHAANPLDAELYTAVVCRPRSPGRTVHITHPWINSCCCISVHRKGAPAERDTQLVSLMAILMFRVTPMMSDELQQTLRPRQNRGEGGVMGLLAECMAVMRQTDTTGVTGGSWLWRLTSCRAPSSTLTPTTAYSVSGVKWRDIGRSLHGPFSLLLGEGEMRGWRLNEVNNMLENLFRGNRWREARLAR